MTETDVNLIKDQHQENREQEDIDITVRITCKLQGKTRTELRDSINAAQIHVEYSPLRVILFALRELI